MKVFLKDFVDIYLGYSFRGAIEEVKKGDLLVLQAKNLNQFGELSYDFVKTLLDKNRGKAFVKDGDVILSNRGTFKAGVYRGINQSLIASSSVYLLRVKDEKKILPEYLAIFLNSDFGQAHLEAINSGTLIKSLPKSDLVNLKVPIPSAEDQKKIIAIHKNHRARSTLYERKIKIHKDLSDYAIYKLITS